MPGPLRHSSTAGCQWLLLLLVWKKEREGTEVAHLNYCGQWRWHMSSPSGQHGMSTDMPGHHPLFLVVAIHSLCCYHSLVVVVVCLFVVVLHQLLVACQLLFIRWAGDMVLPHCRWRHGPCCLCEKRREKGLMSLTWLLSVMFNHHSSIVMSPVSCVKKRMGEGNPSPGLMWTVTTWHIYWHARLSSSVVIVVVHSLSSATWPCISCEQRRGGGRGIMVLTSMLPIVYYYCSSIIICHLAEGNMAPGSCMKRGEG